MSSTIPTATFVIESAVIKAPLSDVWHLIKLQSFDQWHSKIKSAEGVKGVSDETDVVKWTFEDGTVQEVKMEEHSSLQHKITYSIITSQPALSYTSALSTIQCFAVTSGPEANSTFVQFSGQFSSDADAGVVEDGKFKRREALADLAAAATKGRK